MNTSHLSLTGKKRIRNYFGNISEAIKMPNLIEIQKTSYEQFLDSGLSETGKDTKIRKGLTQVFESIFPIKDFSEASELEFISYKLERPKYDVEECRQRGLNYAAPLRVKFRLIINDLDEETEAKTVRSILEQDVYMGDMPLMTEKGTFVINGTERVVVSQMHRSPGVFFDHDGGKNHSSGKKLYSARIIPYRGSWIDLEFDAKDKLFARIDRRRKMAATLILRAFGLDEEEN